MKIMFMAQCYAPENVSAAVLITELASDLAKRGHLVTIVTGAPNYPLGIIFKGYRNYLYSVEFLEGVRVIRTWSYISPSKKLWPRLLHYGSYSVTAFFGGLFVGRPDVIVSYSPPLPLGLSAWFLSRIFRAPWLLQIEDLYPEAAIAAGVMTNKTIIRFFVGVEQFLYRNTRRISVISRNFQHALLEMGIPKSKIEIIPIWADPDKVQPSKKENIFRQTHGLEKKFVVMYAGNLGLTSCLEDVLYAASIIKERLDIKFVIIGEGIKKKSLEEEMQIKQLNNCLFLPYQPREIFPEMLAAADLSLVTLTSNAALSSLPSKIFNVMASARPILAITPIGSEIMQIVEDAECGWNIPPGSPEKLAETIILLRDQAIDLSEIGKNGRTYLEKNYSRNICIDAYEKMLLKLYDL